MSSICIFVKYICFEAPPPPSSQWYENSKVPDEFDAPKGRWATLSQHHNWTWYLMPAHCEEIRAVSVLMRSSIALSFIFSNFNYTRPHISKSVWNVGGFWQRFYGANRARRHVNRKFLMKNCWPLSEWIIMSLATIVIVIMVRTLYLMIDSNSFFSKSAL